jgi:hypothetical protein
MHEKTGRGPGGGGEAVEQGRASVGGEVPGVEQQGEVGAMGLAVDVVGWWVGGFVPIAEESGGDLTASRKTEEANPPGIELPFGGPGAGQLEESLGVLERPAPGGRGGIAGGGGVAGTVAEDEGGDAEAVEPLGGFGPFFVGDDATEPPAGQNDHCRAIGVRGPMQGERGEGHSLEAGDGGIFSGAGGEPLSRVAGSFARGEIGPESLGAEGLGVGLWAGGHECRREEQGEECSAKQAGHGDTTSRRGGTDGREWRVVSRGWRVESGE